MEPDSRPAERDRSIDVARGLAIVAIVLGHVERGLSSASILPVDDALSLDRLLYLFHLATFAYLSGLFLRRSCAAAGAARLVVRRVTLFVWLYLLWTVIQGTVRVGASSLANTPVTWGDVARVWIPEGQLWFLPWLVSVTVLAAVVQPWRTAARGGVAITVAAVVAVAVWGFDPLYAFTRGYALCLPFLIGCVVADRGHVRWSQRRVLVAVVAVTSTPIWLVIGLGTAATTPTTGGDVRTVHTVALGLVGCAAGAAATVAIAALLTRTPAVGALSVLGRYSLEIFLAHIVVTAGTRIGLLQAGVTDQHVHLVAGTALGVTVPVVIAVLNRRWGWSGLFGLPRPLARRVGPTPARGTRA